MKKILIVDDEEDIVEPIQLLLEQEGYTTDVTTRGEQTFSEVRQFHPDLILLDMLMSGTDGRVICEKLKNEEDTKNIPVVMMSAHPGGETESKKCGANDFIAKPFETNELLSTIKNNL